MMDMSTLPCVTGGPSEKKIPWIPESIRLSWLLQYVTVYTLKYPVTDLDSFACRMLLPDTKNLSSNKASILVNIVCNLETSSFPMPSSLGNLQWPLASWVCLLTAHNGHSSLSAWPSSSLKSPQPSGLAQTLPPPGRHPCFVYPPTPTRTAHCTSFWTSYFVNLPHIIESGRVSKDLW